MDFTILHFWKTVFCDVFTVKIQSAKTQTLSHKSESKIKWIAPKNKRLNLKLIFNK